MSLLLALLAFVAQPAAAATSPSMSGLEQQLSYLVAGKSADVGIAALDLKTGESVSIRGNTPFPMASTVKVGGRRALSGAGRSRPALARRHDQRRSRPLA